MLEEAGTLNPVMEQLLQFIGIKEYTANFDISRLLLPAFQSHLFG